MYPIANMNLPNTTFLNAPIKPVNKNKENGLDKNQFNRKT